MKPFFCTQIVEIFRCDKLPVYLVYLYSVPPGTDRKYEQCHFLICSITMMDSILLGGFTAFMLSLLDVIFPISNSVTYNLNGALYWITLKACK